MSRRPAKAPAPSDDELIEAAIARAHADRVGLEASRSEVSTSATAVRRASTRQARSRASERLLKAVQARAAPTEILRLLQAGANVDYVELSMD